MLRISVHKLKLLSSSMIPPPLGHQSCPGCAFAGKATTEPNTRPTGGCNIAPPRGGSAELDAAIDCPVQNAPRSTFPYSSSVRPSHCQPLISKSKQQRAATELPLTPESRESKKGSKTETGHQAAPSSQPLSGVSVQSTDNARKEVGSASFLAVQGHAAQGTATGDSDRGHANRAACQHSPGRLKFLAVDGDSQVASVPKPVK